MFRGTQELVGIDMSFWIPEGMKVGSNAFMYLAYDCENLTSAVFSPFDGLVEVGNDFL